MACQFCGHENPVGGLFCETCGAITVGRLNPDDPQFKKAKEDLRWDVGMRKTLDRILPTWIIWVVIVMIVTSYVGLILSFFGLLSGPSTFDQFVRTAEVTTIISTVITLIEPAILAVLAYYLVKRHNEHSKRESWLKRDITSLVMAAANDPLRREAIRRDLQNLDFYRGTGTWNRRPWFWALFVVLPAIASLITALFFEFAVGSSSMLSGTNLLLVGVTGIASLFAVSIISLVAMLYMFHFLGRDLQSHEDMWQGFTSTTRVLLPRIGIPLRRHYRVKLSPVRSTAVYVILAIFVPFFVYYWWYALVKDPNNHYKNQWEFEDILLESIGSR